jgi:hypothetical protein
MSTIGKELLTIRDEGISMRETTLGKGLAAIREIAKATGADSNAMARAYLSAEANEILNTDCKLMLVNIAIKKIWERIVPSKPFKVSNVVTIENRPKADRPIGDCYINAYKEFIATGNPPIIGWMWGFVGTLVDVIPHAFNYDKRRGTYYDTDKAKYSDSLGHRIAMLCYSVKETEKWYKLPHDLALSPGKFWIYVESEKSVVFIQCRCENSGTPEQVDKAFHSARIEVKTD